MAATSQDPASVRPQCNPHGHQVIGLLGHEPGLAALLAPSLEQGSAQPPVGHKILNQTAALEFMGMPAADLHCPVRVCCWYGVPDACCVSVANKLKSKGQSRKGGRTKVDEVREVGPCICWLHAATDPAFDNFSVVACADNFWLHPGPSLCSRVVTCAGVQHHNRKQTRTNPALCQFM